MYRSKKVNKMKQQEVKAARAMVTTNHDFGVMRKAIT
jgi:hypothetical protein